MALSVDHVNAAASCAAALYGSPWVLGSTGAGDTLHVFLALNGGGKGTIPASFYSTVKSPGRVVLLYECRPDYGYDWAGGTATLNVNISTAGVQRLIGLHVARVNSGCTWQEDLGTNSSLNIDLGSTGVKTPTVTLSAATSPAASDKMMFVVHIRKKTFGFTVPQAAPNQTCDLPGTVVTGGGGPLVNRPNRLMSLTGGGLVTSLALLAPAMIAKQAALVRMMSA